MVVVVVVIVVGGHPGLLTPTPAACGPFTGHGTVLLVGVVTIE